MPEPLGPMMQTTSERATERSTPLSTSCAPKLFPTPLISIIGGHARLSLGCEVGGHARLDPGAEAGHGFDQDPVEDRHGEDRVEGGEGLGGHRLHLIHELGNGDDRQHHGLLRQHDQHVDDRRHGGDQRGGQSPRGRAYRTSSCRRCSPPRSDLWERRRSPRGRSRRNRRRNRGRGRARPPPSRSA